MRARHPARSEIESKRTNASGTSRKRFEAMPVAAPGITLTKEIDDAKNQS
jgi:hypothetical protein